MANDSSLNDPKTIWQNQTTEPSTMTLEKMQQKTQELHKKTRAALIRGMTVPLLVAGIAGWFLLRVEDGPVLRALFVFALAWSLTGQYFLNRGAWPAVLPGHEALSTGLESYRREVQRRRYLSGRFLLWTLGPVVLALATLVVPLVSLGARSGMLFKMIPFLSLMVIWIVSVVVVRMSDRRDLRREIDELNDVERANR